MGFKAGFAALIGKPNAGKSTLLNAFVGRKVSIVSNKPQTTRRRVVGIAQGEGYQIAFLDTPGIHQPKTRLGKAMVDQARSALADVDAIVVVADVSKDPEDLDRGIARLLAPEITSATPVLLALNKMDLLPADRVVNRVDAFCGLFNTDRFMFTSATKGQNVDKMFAMILEVLPEGEPIFPEDEFTDQSARFMVAELVRERVLELTRQEVPHATAVRIDAWEEEDSLLRVSASILVERSGQKAIVIGRHGALIKQIGTEARKDIEDLLGRHIFLDLHVGVRENWRMSPSTLKDLEYI